MNTHHSRALWKSALLAAAVFLAAISGQTAVILLINSDFDDDPLPQSSWSTVLGWTASGNNANNSGTDAYLFPGNDLSAVLHSDDDGVYQTTGYTIAAGDTFTVSFDAANVQASDLNIILYYVDDLDDRIPLVTEVRTPVPFAWAAFSFDYSLIVPAAVGRTLGIEFDNQTVGSTQVYFDNIDLSVTAIPEPASIAMFAVAAGALLLVRRRTRGAA